MADNESNQDNANESAPSRASSGDGERTYTKAELEGIVRSRVKDYGSVKESLAEARAAAEIATLRAEYITDAARRGLDLEVVGDLFDSYRAKAADDRPAWFDKMTAAFKSSAPQPPVSKPPASAPAKDTVSASDKGAPTPAPRDVNGVSNLNDLTRADLERERELHGEEEANRRIVARVNKWLSGTQLKVT